MQSASPPSLIRSGSAASDIVQALGARARAPQQDPVITALETEVLELKRTLAAERARHEVDLITARTEAHAEAERSFTRNEEAARDRLGKALTSAQTSLETTLNGLDALALAVSETALAAVFDDPEHFRGLIESVIMRQIAMLRSELFVEVKVSEKDFASAQALDALAAHIGEAVRVRSDPTLGAGSCRMLLKAGEIEINVVDHWRALKALFGELAESGAP
jgi:flagellar biosynthesis/type III secretory pathway protein FliH